MAALPSITSLLSDGTSSGDNLDKTEIRPHPSAASQNLINVSTSNETNNSETLHVTKTSSDTFLHTKAAKDAASSSSVHSEGGDPTSPPLVRKTSSTPQLHKWGTQSSDSGRSSAVVSPKQDSANTQDTLTKASQHLEDAVSDDLQTDDLEDPSGNLGNGTINNKSGDNENHDNDHVETDNSFPPTDSYQRVSRSLDGNLFGSTSTDSRRESLSDLSIHRPDSFVYIRSQVYQNPDDALNLSRGAGLPGEQMASADSNKRSHHGSASSDIRNFMVDKEVIESQLRKLQVENSTLHTENKLLKEKYNRSQVKVRQVESQLLAAQKEAEEQHSELQRESQEHSEQDRWRLEEEIARLKREVQRLKAENASLQKQLDANKHNANLHKQFTDRSLVIESYKIQVTSITEELRRAKQLIHESEAAREAEVEKRQEASAQVVKLTQMKALLQQEIENSAGGTVAQKQVRSLEQRLRITEERLHQERADRAAKLSEVEESLIKQNATLQVSEKELTRKLQREKDRSKNLDRKYRDARDQNEKLQLESFEKPSFLITNNNNNTYSQLNGSLANKKLREEKFDFEEHWQDYQDNLQDSYKNRQELEAITNSQIHDLLQEKHNLRAKLRNVEDANAAITAENQSLHHSLNTSSAAPSKPTTAAGNPWAAQVESLKCDVVTTRGDLERQSRSSRLMESELESLRKQLAAKERALDEALEEMRLLSGFTPGSAEAEQQRMRIIEKLNAEATEEKSGHQQLRAELGETTRQVEVLRQEYDIVSANLDSERKRIQTLKDQCQVEEDKVIQVEDRLKGQHLELETVKSHLVESRNTIDQYKKDKQLLYQDVQDLCNKLADRDETIGRLQHKCTNAVENLHKDYANEKTYLVEDKQRLEESLSKAKEETEELNQKLRQKEQQLDAHFRTHKELEQESRARLELESKISSLDSELHELKRSLNDVQSENNRLVEHSKETQESLSKARETNTSLKEQVRVQRDTFTKEIHELRHTLTEEKHKHETVSSDKQQEYNRVVSDSRAMEVSLSSLSEAKESLQETNRIQEKTIDALKTELNEETTSRKLADQRLESLVAQLKEIQTTRAGYDSRTADLQTNLAKVQAQLNVEKEQCRKLKREFNDLQSSSLSQETLNQTLQINVTELRAEVAALTSQLETTTQDLTGCNARLTLELKQQTEDFDKEREKLTLQAQQLSVELEKVRELIAQKNQDALQMQQDVLSLEEKLREATSQLKQAQESLNIELETREKLDQRNMELELLLARLRSKDGDDDLALFDQTRSEVSRKMQEMSRHMRDRLDQQREEEVEARNRELRRLEEYKKRITSLESALSEEQAMHIVTKTQMSSLEDDNQRLRQQLQAARKKATTNTDSDRSKSRMEEINEIILRSQTRAQQLLASGAYGEDPLRTLSPSRDFMATAPPTVFLNVSPEQRTYDPNKSLGSDDISLLMSTPEKKKL